MLFVFSLLDHIFFEVCRSCWEVNASLLTEANPSLSILRAFFLAMEPSDHTRFRVVHATLTEHKMAKFLLQLLYLNGNSGAPHICGRMSRTGGSRRKTSHSFSISPAVFFRAAEEQGHGGRAAANKKWDAGGYGGGQQPAGAGSAGGGILLTGFLLFSF